VLVLEILFGYVICVIRVIEGDTSGYISAH